MSEPRYVLDASAILSLLLAESGSERIVEALGHAVISAVNFSEVVAKLQERGMPDGAIDEALDQLGLDVIPFDSEQAVRAGKLRIATRSAGLSLGDRACLALAQAAGGIALTTDRAWKALPVDVRIELTR